MYFCLCIFYIKKNGYIHHLMEVLFLLTLIFSKSQRYRKAKISFCDKLINLRKLYVSYINLNT